MAHYFPYDVKLRLLAHSRSVLANQKARNPIVGAENLLIIDILRLEEAICIFKGNLNWFFSGFYVELHFVLDFLTGKGGAQMTAILG